MGRIITTKQEFTELPDLYRYHSFYCDECKLFFMQVGIPTEFGLHPVRFETLSNWPKLNGEWLDEKYLERLRCPVNNEHKVVLYYTTEPLGLGIDNRDNQEGAGRRMGDY